MNCEQFQEVLPHIIDEGGNDDARAHSESCPACGELVRDLRYISEQAPLLLPMHDPGPHVWESIQQSLISEGLIRGDRTPKPSAVVTMPQTARSWTVIGALFATAAVVLLGAVLLNYQPRTPVKPAPAPGPDDQLISQVSKKDPAVAKAYEESLKQVNSYIADAQKAVDNDRNDAAANEQLLDAYQQKAMLYDMATARSME